MISTIIANNSSWGFTQSKRFLLNPSNIEKQPSDYEKGRNTLQNLATKVGLKLDSKPIRFTTSLSEGMNFQDSLVYGLSNAYSLHQSISIAPHDLWYVVLTEIAREVNKRPEDFRKIFTSSETKIDILVPSVTGSLPLELIIDKLIALVPVDLNLFIPEFSTYTQMSLAAAMAAFADATKSYYNYMTFCCGIREIEFRGSVEDWMLMVIHAHELQKVFHGTVLAEFLERVKFRAQSLVGVISGGDSEVLKTIFTQTRIGSGGELKIDGWFAQDFFLQGGGHKIENYPNTWSLVPFKCLTTGRRFTDVYGAFHNEIQDGFRVQNYGRITFEL